MRYGTGARSEVVHIDYADVMKQAVANERSRVLRNVYEVLNTVATTQHERGSTYRTTAREAAVYRNDVRKMINELEDIG